MSEMIERLKARARATELDCAAWADECLEELVRALLDEMRAPTQAMLDNPPQWTWTPAQKWRHFIEWALK